MAANDNKKRRGAIQGLIAWLKVRSAQSPNGVMDELEMRKLWRGLFFCMWLADKAPVQNELAMNIAELVHCFETNDGVRSWMLICGQTMRGEWGRLDKYRIDKFYTMFRHIIHEVIIYNIPSFPLSCTHITSISLSCTPPLMEVTPSHFDTNPHIYTYDTLS